MATTKTTKSTTKQRTTGTKAKTRTAAAGKTAKVEEFKVPRTAKQLAAGIQARMKRSPNFWNEIVAAMRSATSPRVTQDMPRSGNGEAGATH